MCEECVCLLTLSGVVVSVGAGLPRAGGLLLGEADDACDLTACSKRPPLHLTYQHTHTTQSEQPKQYN